MKINVVLAVPRAGAVAENRGDTIAVTPAEAKRMLAAGQIQPLTGEAEKELAALPTDAGTAEKVAADKAAAEKAEAEKAAAEKAAKKGKA